jgi:CheY-like chemotaxis protein
MKYVLFADDDELTREILAINLENHGLAGLWATDGLEALEIFNADKDGQIGFIILDKLMPNCSGPKTYHKIRAKNPTIPIAFISANLDDMCIEDPNLFYIEKPIDSFKLMLLVKGFV